MRQTAVDLTINPDTVVRAYRELEILGVIETHQDSGTFVARAGAAGFQLEDILTRLQ
jgi:GntR family transcriptional regulator